jgi:hypothetical protein
MNAPTTVPSRNPTPSTPGSCPSEAQESNTSRQQPRTPAGRPSGEPTHGHDQATTDTDYCSAVPRESSRDPAESGTPRARAFPFTSMSVLRRTLVR